MVFNPRRGHLGKTRVILVGLRIPSRPGVRGDWQVRLISPDSPDPLVGVSGFQFRILETARPRVRLNVFQFCPFCLVAFVGFQL